MTVRKKCVGCLCDFENDEPGVAGVFALQNIPAGICPQCRRKFDDRHVSIFPKMPEREERYDNEKPYHPRTY